MQAFITLKMSKYDLKNVTTALKIYQDSITHLTHFVQY